MSRCGHAVYGQQGDTVTRSILVVDDAAFMRMLLRDILVSGGYSVHEAVDGDDAVARYRELRPDVVTMDVTMPGRDGIEALADIVGEDPSARVIVVSALGQTDIVQSALDAGAFGYLVKPFQPDNVLALVQGALETRIAGEAQDPRAWRP
jgi:two-component system, chemotaxis family, chemotaxis protein CheY